MSFGDFVGTVEAKQNRAAQEWEARVDEKLVVK